VARSLAPGAYSKQIRSPGRGDDPGLPILSESKLNDLLVGGSGHFGDDAASWPSQTRVSLA
jgi:hypothetical protein